MILDRAHVSPLNDAILSLTEVMLRNEIDQLTCMQAQKPN